MDNTNQDLQNSELDTQAKQIVSLLDAHANRLSMRTLKKLDDGRQKAIRAHAQRISGVGVNHDGTLNSIYSWAEHHRIISAGLVLGTIIAGLVLMQSFSQKDSSDAYLLSAELPPEAFVDRSFEPYLNNGQAKL